MQTPCTYLQELNKPHNVILATVWALHSLYLLFALQQLAKVGFPQPAEVCLRPLACQNVLEHIGTIIPT